MAVNLDSEMAVTNPIAHQFYADLGSQLFEESTPSHSAAPTMIELNLALLDHLGVDAAWFKSADGLSALAGNATYDLHPIALAYGGHQFGHWSPSLGDGRAHMLGQVKGADGSAVDIQLKGSGRTPFSRSGDGRATLGAVLREYMMSEAMSGFQYASANLGEQGVRDLADFIIEHNFPELKQLEDKYLQFLNVVVERQASLISHWMSVGFIHGVMNTDNMSIVGETIDYGPCAFMDEFLPQKVFSSIDRNGRYAWDQQASVGYWNLAQLTSTLLPLIDADSVKAEALAKAKLEAFIPSFRMKFHNTMREKLGLPGSLEMDIVTAFAGDTLTTLAENGVDFTVFFDQLTGVAGGVEQAIEAAVEHEDFEPFRRLCKVLANSFELDPVDEELQTPPSPEERVFQTFCGT